MIFKLIRRFQSGPPGAAALLMVLSIAACAERGGEIYQASETGGDYAILDCSQLDVAERSIGQRLSGSANYSLVGEPANLLASQQNQISATRASRRCAVDATVPAATPAEIARTETQSIPLQNPTYLQVATFRNEANRDRTVADLTAQGYQTFVRPIELAGQTYYRVIVGPLSSVGDVASLDAATIRMGFNDTFFVKG